jgi:hypothetical protein
MRRMILSAVTVVGFAVPTSIAAVTLTAGPAAAASSIQCGKLAGDITGTIVIAKCSPKNKLYKTLSGTASLLAGGGALTWSPGGQTTIVSAPTTTSPGQGSCPNKWTEYDSTGTVTGGTSTYTHAGDTFSSKSCVKGTKIKNLKHTTVAF